MLLVMKMMFKIISIIVLFMDSWIFFLFFSRQRYIGQTASFRSGCFSYSNEVYGFAGEMLAQVANKTFAELVSLENNIFTYLDRKVY